MAMENEEEDEKRETKKIIIFINKFLLVGNCEEFIDSFINFIDKKITDELLTIGKSES